MFIVKQLRLQNEFKFIFVGRIVWHIKWDDTQKCHKDRCKKQCFFNFYRWPAAN